MIFSRLNLIFCLVLVCSILNSCGESESSQNSSETVSENYQIPYQDSKGRWGFIDNSGNIILEAELENSPSLAINGLSYYSKYDDKEKRYKLNFFKIENKKIVEIEHEFELTNGFSEGLAGVTKKGGKIEFIDPNMNVVFSTDAESVTSFSGGMAAFRDDQGKMGFLNRKGEITIEAKYDNVGSFQNGFAVVTNYNDENKKGSSRTINFMIIDPTGKVVLDLKDKYSQIRHISSNGLIAVMEDRKIGFISIKDGEKLKRFDDSWGDVRPFINGYASFRDNNGTWGIVDEKGEVIKKVESENPILVENNAYWYKEGGFYGLKTLDGEKLIRPNEYNFTDVKRIGNDIYAVKEKGKNSYYLINSQGNEVSKEEFTQINDNEYISAIFGFKNTNQIESDYVDLARIDKVLNSDIIQMTTLKDLMSSFQLENEVVSNIVYKSYRREETDSGYGIRGTLDDDLNFTSYKNYIETRKEDDSTKVKSPYPIKSPFGISSVRYNNSFEENIGQSEKIFDQNNYYEEINKPKTKFELNPKVKIQSLSCDILLEERYSTHSQEIAKHIADSWKSKINNQQIENKSENDFNLKGVLGNGYSIEISKNYYSSIRIVISAPRVESSMNEYQEYENQYDGIVDEPYYDEGD